MAKTNPVKHKAFFESLKKVPLEIINQEYELIKEKKSYLTASQREIVVGFAQYILKEGLKILNSAGTVENTGGAINKTSAKKHKAVKPEAHPIAFGVGG